jgi:ActR/RegA family two-component response regulator
MSVTRGRGRPPISPGDTAIAKSVSLAGQDWKDIDKDREKTGENVSATIRRLIRAGLRHR